MKPRPCSGTRLLVSVRNAAEAQLALAAGPYLIDIKDPDHGALGALPPSEIAAIVASVSGRAVTSAVAGEPETWEELVGWVRAVAATDVDLVKVALPGAMLDRIPASAMTEACPKPVIAVLFAEDGPGPGLVPRIAGAGFFGAMIDTRVKDGTSLLDRLPLESLAAFLEACRAHDLMTGLAGSLQVSDIPVLAPLGPDYLGFRGGLCRSGRRRGELDPERLRQAWAALDVALNEPVPA